MPEQQLLPQFAPSGAQREALGLARAQAVQQAVLANSELKPERVFLVNQQSGGGPEGSVRMELKLEYAPAGAARTAVPAPHAV